MKKYKFKMGKACLNAIHFQLQEMELDSVTSGPHRLWSSILIDVRHIVAKRFIATRGNGKSEVALQMKYHEVMGLYTVLNTTDLDEYEELSPMIGALIVQLGRIVL